MSTYLIHHGIKGQRWGIRRYQGPDGRLTDLGRKRYGYGNEHGHYIKYERLSRRADKVLSDNEYAEYCKRLIDEHGGEEGYRKWFLEEHRHWADAKKYLEEDIARARSYKSGDDYAPNAVRKNIKKELNDARQTEEYKRIKDAADKSGYGSYDWFEWQQYEYKIQEEIGKRNGEKLAIALLEGTDIDKSLDTVFIPQEYMVSIGLSRIGGTGGLHYGSDYDSISNPLTGRRDYGLEEKYEAYETEKKRRGEW